MTPTIEERYRRLGSSSLLIFSLVLMVFFAPAWMLGVTVALFAAAGMLEFFNLVERKGIVVHRWAGLTVAIAIVLSTSLQFEVTRGWELFFMVAACLAVFILQLARRSSDGAIAGISTTFFGIVYVAWLLSFIVKIRLLPLETPGIVLEDGRWLVFFLLLVVKIGDAGAYFVGSAVGRHALIPQVSPRKTVEGLIGGLVLSVATAAVVKPFVPTVSNVHLVALGLLLGAAGQIGKLPNLDTWPPPGIMGAQRSSVSSAAADKPIQPMPSGASETGASGLFGLSALPI